MIKGLPALVADAHQFVRLVVEKAADAGRAHARRLCLEVAQVTDHAALPEKMPAFYGAQHMPRFVEVAKKSQIPENGKVGIEVEGKHLALINLNGEIYAIDDDCPHEGGPLSEGQIIGEEIECPWHTSHFNIKTGRVTTDPATTNVATYRVRLVGDAVEVEI